MKDNEGNSPLDVAVRENELDTAFYLFNNGCDSDEDKDKVLMLACKEGELKVVKELIEQHSVNSEGKSSTLLCMKNQAVHILVAFLNLATQQFGL